MTLGLYHPGTSPLHRLPAGAKTLALVAGGTAVFLIRDPAALGVALAGVAGLYALARIPARVAIDQIRPTLWLLALIFAVQAVIDHWTTGLLVVQRFAVLILLASLVTLTTRVSDMVDALQSGLRPLSRLGLDTDKIALAISLALRFIPVIAGLTQEVREAQRARGLDRSLFAVAVPVIVRTLKMADDIAQAMEARSYDPGRTATRAQAAPTEASTARGGPP